MEVLPVEELRKLAASEGYQETGQLKVYQVILFSKHEGETHYFLEAYVKAGDVAVILPHPRQKAWRLFHFGALTSAELLRSVLQAPFSDSNFSYHLSDWKILPPPPPSGLATALERQMTLIDREIGDLQRERMEMYKKWKSMESDHQSLQGDDEAVRSNSRVAPASVSAVTGDGTRGFAPEAGRMTSVASDVLVSRANGDRTRGNKAVWSLFYPDNQDVFARAWTAKSVNSVTLGRGFVVSYDDGSATWSDIPTLLEAKLRQQGVASPTNAINLKGSAVSNNPAVSAVGSALAVRIRYLILGDEGNFYVKFDNGRMEWCGQDSFGAALRRGVSERHLLVEKVAFAQEGGWLIIWSDRTFEAENIPETLEQRLGGSRFDGGRVVGSASGIKDLTLGPAGEWFIIYKDHSVQADNLPDSLYKCLSQIRERGGRVRAIVFGENRSWFVRYWDGGQ